MKSVEHLTSILRRIDGRGYPAYKDIKGEYSFTRGILYVDHVQGDPFAAPSKMRVRILMTDAGFPPETYANRIRDISLRDFLARRFSRGCRRATDRLGSGKSGLLAMDIPQQEILERSSIVVNERYVEARFVCGLPAHGRRILGKEANRLLCETVPNVAHQALFYASIDSGKLQHHQNTAEDADALRNRLAENGLVAFVADGSRLPRRSGIDDRPLETDEVVLFETPESLRVELDTPHSGPITGMGIPDGVSLIIGGGYHGKSTLLQALERGVYNHIPGDGRERVVTEASATKIRAEDGRRVEAVDIRPFIAELPNGADVATFRSDNASGSTSQAANTLEAIECGCRVLLLDEDTCATNLLIRDARMQALVEKAGEPITPFVDRVRELTNRKKVSSILVLGGSGDYLEVADTVIRMDRYRARDVTGEAKNIAADHPTGRSTEETPPWPADSPQRRIVARSLDPRKGRREVNIKARGLRAVVFGTEEIDLSSVAQLVDEGQVRALGRALYLVRSAVEKDSKSETVSEAVGQVMRLIDSDGLDILDNRPNGDFVEFRKMELAAAVNRLRSLQIRTQS